MSQRDYQNLLMFFEYQHLPPKLQEVSKPFCNLTHTLVEILTPLSSGLDENPEFLTGLRKLLEAKDCFVRAKLLADKFREEMEAREPVKKVLRCNVCGDQSSLRAAADSAGVAEGKPCVMCSRKETLGLVGHYELVLL